MSAYSILKNNGLINHCLLSEEFITQESHLAFSVTGRDHLINAIASQASSSAIGLYTCEPYTFIIGVHNNAVFVLDTHQIGEVVGGMATEFCFTLTMQLRGRVHIWSSGSLKD